MPLIGGFGTGLGANVNSASILAVIGFFILLMASKYVDMVKDALKVPPFKYGTAIGEALTYGWRPFGQAGGAVVQAGKGRAYEEVVARMGGGHAGADSLPARLIESWKRKG